MSKEKDTIKKLNKQAKIKKGIPKMVAEAMTESAKFIANKYKGPTIIKILKGISKHKDKINDIPGFNANVLNREKEMMNVQHDQFVKGKNPETMINPKDMKKGKKVGIKKMQSGGRVGAPKGTGAALRGFGKGYK
jgi:hypothetical protein